jgi:hypothetical protein
MQEQNEASGRPTPPRPRGGFSRVETVTSTAAGLLGAGSRRGGVIILAVLVCGAVLLPVLLMSIVNSADPAGGSAVLGLLLRVIVDLLVAVLVLGVLTHKLTGRRLRTANRSLGRLGARTSKLERLLDEQSTALSRQPAPPAVTAAAVEAVVKDVGRRLQVATATDVGNRHVDPCSWPSRRSSTASTVAWCRWSTTSRICTTSAWRSWTALPATSDHRPAIRWFPCSATGWRARAPYCSTT